jgi:hypothetical protein
MSECMVASASGASSALQVKQLASVLQLCVAASLVGCGNTLIREWSDAHHSALHGTLDQCRWLQHAPAAVPQLEVLVHA